MKQIVNDKRLHWRASLALARLVLLAGLFSFGLAFFGGHPASDKSTMFMFTRTLADKIVAGERYFETGAHAFSPLVDMSRLFSEEIETARTRGPYQINLEYVKIFKERHPEFALWPSEILLEREPMASWVAHEYLQDNVDVTARLFAQVRHRLDDLDMGRMTTYVGSMWPYSPAIVDRAVAEWLLAKAGDQKENIGLLDALKRPSVRKMIRENGGLNRVMPTAEEVLAATEGPLMKLQRGALIVKAMRDYGIVLGSGPVGTSRLGAVHLPGRPPMGEERQPWAVGLFLLNVFVLLRLRWVVRMARSAARRFRLWFEEPSSTEAGPDDPVSHNYPARVVSAPVALTDLQKDKVRDVVRKGLENARVIIGEEASQIDVEAVRITEAGGDLLARAVTQRDDERETHALEINFTFVVRAPPEQLIPVLVHELFHMIYPDWPESRIKLVTQFFLDRQGLLLEHAYFLDQAEGGLLNGLQIQVADDWRPAVFAPLARKVLDEAKAAFGWDKVHMLEMVRGLEPFWDKALWLLGTTYLGMGEHDRAAKCFRDELPLRMADRKIRGILYGKLIDISLLKENLPETVALLSEAILAMPDDHVFPYQKAKLLMQMDPPRVGEALQTMADYLKVSPDDNLAYSQLAKMYGDIGKSERALGILGERLPALEVLRTADPRNKDLIKNLVIFYTQKADILCSLNRYAEAEDVAEKALALNHDDRYTMSVMVWIKMRLGKFDEALRTVETGLKANPLDRVFRKQRVAILCILGQYNRAIHVLLTALRESPNDFYTHELLFLVYFGLGLLAEARRETDAMLRLRKDEPWAIFHRVDILLAYGEVEEAWELLYPSLKRFESRSTEIRGYQRPSGDLKVRNGIYSACLLGLGVKTYLTKRTYELGREAVNEFVESSSEKLAVLGPHSITSIWLERLMERGGSFDSYRPPLLFMHDEEYHILKEHTGEDEFPMGRSYLTTMFPKKFGQRGA